MSLQNLLLTDFVASYPAQPATAYWRGIEVAHVLESGLPDGLGLDLGCGDGILTSLMLRHTGDRRLVGIDIDPEETQAALAYPFYERVHTSSAAAVPEPDGTFDFVMSISVLEHVDALEAIIAESARVLKPGGTFMFAVPTTDFRGNLAGPMLGGNRSSYLKELDARIAHFNYLSPDEWRQLCERSGLGVEQCTGYLSRGETQRWETLSRFTGGLLYRVAGKQRRPIEIQRRLGLRALQNRGGLPRPMSRAIAAALKVGVSSEIGTDKPSCILLRGTRR